MKNHYPDPYSWSRFQLCNTESRSQKRFQPRQWPCFPQQYFWFISKLSTIGQLQLCRRSCKPLVWRKYIQECHWCAARWFYFAVTIRNCITRPTLKAPGSSDRGSRLPRTGGTFAVTFIPQWQRISSQTRTSATRSRHFCFGRGQRLWVPFMHGQMKNLGGFLIHSRSSTTLLPAGQTKLQTRHPCPSGPDWSCPFCWQQFCETFGIFKTSSWSSCETRGPLRHPFSAMNMFW